jgi:hypothetical protein
MPRVDNSRHIVSAARRRSALAYERAEAALKALTAAGQPISFPAVAHGAGVSRAYLYAQPELRARIAAARTAPGNRDARPRAPANERGSEASLLARIRHLEHENQALREERRLLHSQLAAAHGALRAARASRDR